MLEFGISRRKNVVTLKAWGLGECKCEVQSERERERETREGLRERIGIGIEGRLVCLFVYESGNFNLDLWPQNQDDVDNQ